MLFQVSQSPLFFFSFYVWKEVVPKAEEEKGDNAKKTKNKFLAHSIQYLKENVICRDWVLPHQ